MDLVAGVRKVVVMMEHNSKRGDAKLVKACSLPLTGASCIDMVITDLCVLEMDQDKSRFRLTEVAPGVGVDEVIEKTEAELVVEGDPATMDA